MVFAIHWHQSAMGVRCQFLSPKWLNIIDNSCVFLHNSHNMEAGILFYNPYKCVTGPVSLDFLHWRPRLRAEKWLSQVTRFALESLGHEYLFPDSQVHAGFFCFFFFYTPGIKELRRFIREKWGIPKTALVVLNKLERPEELRPKEIETDQLFPCITFH